MVTVSACKGKNMIKDFLFLNISFQTLVLFLGLYSPMLLHWKLIHIHRLCFLSPRLFFYLIHLALTGMLFAFAAKVLCLKQQLLIAKNNLNVGLQTHHLSHHCSVWTHEVFKDSNLVLPLELVQPIVIVYLVGRFLKALCADRSDTVFCLRNSGLYTVYIQWFQCIKTAQTVYKR